MGNSDLGKRRFGRVPVKISVKQVKKEVTDTDTFLSHNLSEGGMFIASDDPLPVGSRIVLSFEIPSPYEKFQLDAVVMWTRKDANDEMNWGMGVEFVGVSETTQQTIKKYVESRSYFFTEEKG